MRRITLVILLATLSCVMNASAQLSDSQITSYIIEGTSLGKSRQQIYTDLISQGVPLQKLNSIYDPLMPETDDQMSVVDDEADRLRASLSSIRNTNAGYSPNKRKIFGHNIFNLDFLTFEPSVNIATPAGYKLGPGDEVIIDVWGGNQATIRRVISPDGSIFVSGIGPVYLSGLTVSDANKSLQWEFGKIYSGIDGDPSYIKLTLGQIRTIQVNVMGEVVAPGTYALSSFATVFHALYQAGGINDIGSLRKITIVRDNKPLKEIDIYDYILKGSSSDFIRLSEGDVILVPTYDKLVEIEGSVKRPMYFEMKRNESLKVLIEYAGGFTGNAFSKRVNVQRYNGLERQIFSVDQAQYGSFVVADGDKVIVGAALDRYDNRVEIRGAVMRPGFYQMDDNVTTILSLIERAEGLRGDEFTNRAILTRENEDLTVTLIPVDLGQLLAGEMEDMSLRPNDVIYIPSIHYLTEHRTVRIDGAVANSGTYEYVQNMTIEDLIVLSGGLLESASEMKVDVFRRARDPKRTEELNMIGQSYTFALKEGLIIDEIPGFILEPFDEVVVRYSPGYQYQQVLYVRGEVLYPGRYVITKKGQRLSELVEASGGLTSSAYTPGARLIRTLSEEEKVKRDRAMRLATRQHGGGDSVSMSLIETDNTFSVGIELNKAIENPYSDYDMILREGDVLVIPEYNNTVKITGAVLHSNTVLFKEGENLRYYINQAGGFSPNARKRKVYVVYMNGMVSKYKGKKTLSPGIEIIVPSKREKQKMSMGEILGLTTSAASVGTMGAAIANVAK